MLAVSLRAFFGGLFMGLAVSTRLYLAALWPVFLWLFIKGAGTRTTWTTISFLWGSLIGMLPAALFFIAAPEIFWFNNIGYHLSRSNETWQNMLAAKSSILQAILGIKDASQFSGMDVPMLFWAAILLVVLGILFKQICSGSAAVLALVIVLISLIPTPSYIQYFSLVVPFLIVIITEATARFASTSGVAAVSSFTAAILFLALYFASFADNVERYTRSGVGVIGIGAARDTKSWRIETMEDVAESVDRRVSSADKAAALWPGYLLESRAVAVAGLENQFGRKAAFKVTDDVAGKYKLINRDQLAKKIKAAKIRVVVAAIPPDRMWLIDALQGGGYQLSDLIGDVRIWSRMDRATGEEL
jgi:hypothetical protein